jgi:hypothetical protein
MMEISWKRILIKFLIGFAVLAAGMTAYSYWLARDGFCVRVYPDGSQKTLYGSECGFR